MSMTDPIADMLARIRNALQARKLRVDVPASRIKQHIAQILKDEGFINDVRPAEGRKHPTLTIELKWTLDRRPAIAGIRRVSRPGRRAYVGKETIPRVRGGQGIAILSTSRGVMTDRLARKQAVGGEVICEVW